MDTESLERACATTLVTAIRREREKTLKELRNERRKLRDALDAQPPHAGVVALNFDVYNMSTNGTLRVC